MSHSGTARRLLGLLPALGAAGGLWLGGLAPRALAASASASASADLADSADGEADVETASDAGEGGNDSPAGGEPSLPPDIELLIRAKEKEAAGVRREGIKLLEEFLADSRDTRETAEALFKLAELTWEEAQAGYLAAMGRYQEAVEACHADRAQCRNVPQRRPRLDLTRAQVVYQRLIREFPRFRKIDTVIYLYAFSLRDQGKIEEAVKLFYKILKDFPRSRFRADAWMALGEFRFYERQDFTGALRAYENVVKFPSSQLFGLALFKSAWCFWKLGDGDKAAQRFKDVLDLAEKAKGRGETERKRAAELQDQALDYLVELFTEDDTKSAKDAFDFMVQIGGKAYSTRVLKRLADTVYDQTRYERAAEAYLFLLTLDATGKDAPEHQIRVVDSFQSLGKNERAAAEMRKLAINYGPRSDWAKANKDRPNTVLRARVRAEEFIRVHAKTLHSDAQKNEKESKVVDKALYSQAADAYGFFLEQFPDAKDATELRYYRADITYFKLGDYRAAGDGYLAVAKSKPVGPFHKDALLQAMSAFEKLRPPAPKTAAEKQARKVTDEDRKFAEAADLYAEILPEDKDIITVIYKNGQFFYDYGEYDEAVKRFGLILERYPDSPLATAAGDRILQSFGESKDYDNIEHWARRLKKAKSFQAREEQARLDGLIVGAMSKSAEKFAEAKEYDKAAARFRQVADDFPRDPAAPRALFNAGSAFEKAGKPADAVAAYESLADDFPRTEQAPEGLLVAAKLEESIAGYQRAAELYERLHKGYPRHKEARSALKNAGILRQSLGQFDKAAAHYAVFEQEFKGSEETRDVAFQRALLMAEKGDDRRAAAVFGEFIQKYPKDDRLVEASVRQAKAYLKLGADNKAEDSLKQALAQFRREKGSRDAALYGAEARFLQGDLLFREYDRVKIAGGPKQLARALEKKAALLDDAKKVYLDVVSFKVPEWATAALYQIGKGYARFASAIRDTKVPAQLSEDEKVVYQEELEKSVIVIEEKALDAYRMGYAKAIEIGVYNQHTKSLREALSELDASSFPPERESRMRSSLGERPIALKPLEEIRRD